MRESGLHVGTVSERVDATPETIKVHSTARTAASSWRTEETQSRDSHSNDQGNSTTDDRSRAENELIGYR